MPSDDQSLADLRRQIDDIDARIHDLLMQRTQMAQRIGTLKPADSMQMRPGREAKVLRRLIARHEGDLPKALVVRIWREIFSALTTLQGPFAVAVFAPEGTFGFRNLARDHFGWRTPITAYRSAAQVLEAVGDGRATVGVLPMPRSDEAQPWWRHLARTGEAVPRIVARLPFAVVEPVGSDSAEALAISLRAAEETGLDRAFLMVETEQVVSRSHLKDLLEGTGLTVVDVQVAEDEGRRTLHLVEVEGFVPEDDDRLDGLRRQGEGTVIQVRSVGGFAVPLSWDEMNAAGGGSPDP